MRRAQWAAMLGAALLLSACGTEPEPLQEMQPDAPADLCATVPAEARQGLQASSNTDTTGAPTAACSLRSAPGTKPEVHAVITWNQLDDDGTADGVLASQCRSIDKSVYKEQPNFAVPGAEKACAGSGKLGAADAATIAALAGREVLTVRWSSQPAGPQPAMTQSTQILQGVLDSLSAGS
jgi:hypothetical protein